MLAKAAAVVQKDFLTAVRYRNGVLLSAFAPAMQLLMSFYLAHAVGPHRRAAVRADVQARRVDLVLRAALIAAGLRGLLLGDGHERLRSLAQRKS